MKAVTVVLCAILWFFAGCGHEGGHHEGASSSSGVPLFDDLGTHTHPIATRAPLAQSYFDQGLRLVYGFNHDEAKRAFEEAARLDPGCAMAWWGVAYTLGPNINLPTDPEREKAAAAAVLKAQSLSAGATGAERAYIEALAKRYSVDPGSDRGTKDQAYADAMRELSRKYPDDLDAQTLFAEAMMNLRPWKLWTKDGQPAPGTNEIVETLESVLDRNPDHPGANHYYIHAIEASPQPERALAAAERLPDLVPGAGHLVHMPAHIYQRTGRYGDAADANRDAAAVDRKYLAMTGAGGVYPMMYYNHNLQFLSASAAMDGRSKESIEAAREMGKHLTPEMIREMPMVEFVAPQLLWALARFGKWGGILAEPKPPEFMQYTTGMWHYVRGLALNGTGREAEAEAERKSLGEIRARIPADLMMNLNSAEALLTIASLHLSGEIAAKKERWTDAVRDLTEAIRLEDDLSYDEPPAWHAPVRQTLGAVLLAAGRPAEAERVYRDDLGHHPKNGWSLFGLAQSLRQQNAERDAAEADERFRAAWERADVELTSSRF